MAKHRRRNEEKCSVEVTLDVIGGRWKSVVVYHLLSGTKRFGELRRLIPLVSERMLTAQLRQLETDRILLRKVYAEVPPRVEYSLTDYGKSLRPIIMQMKEWGKKYLQDHYVDREKARTQTAREVLVNA